MTRSFALTILVATVFSVSQAQTQFVDSLRSSLYSAQSKRERLAALLSLGREQHNLNRDSAYEYTAEAMSLSAEGDNRTRTLAALYFAQSYIPWGWTDSAQAVLDKVVAQNPVSDISTRDLHFQLLRIFEAIKAGASGYLLKHEPAEVLRDAVTQVMEYGGAPMSPAIARKTLQLMRRAMVPDGMPGTSLPEWITRREEEILQHMVSGEDAKRIASMLDISVTTVRKHISNIYEKLHVQSRAQVINMAHHNKWFGA